MRGLGEVLTLGLVDIQVCMLARHDVGRPRPPHPPTAGAADPALSREERGNFSDVGSCPPTFPERGGDGATRHVNCIVAGYGYQAFHIDRHGRGWSCGGRNGAAALCRG